MAICHYGLTIWFTVTRILMQLSDLHTDLFLLHYILHSRQVNILICSSNFLLIISLKQKVELMETFVYWKISLVQRI